MSKKLEINKYYIAIEEAARLGLSRKETSLRRHFANLVDAYGEEKRIKLIDEKEWKNADGKIKYPDGELQFEGIALGHWESKDKFDNLEKEVKKKFNDAGYPSYNILFEDSQTAILYQGNPDKPVKTANMRDWKELNEILLLWINYETKEVRNFRDALQHFSTEVPSIVEILWAVISISSGEKTIADFDTALHHKIKDAKANQKFIDARRNFWQACQISINPNISISEIDEMIIQHILTKDVFNSIFNTTAFHEENNIAKELNDLVQTFFTGNLRVNTVDKISGFYIVIKERAAQIQSHKEKQNFLKIIYETFYKAYNPKAADRLGIVYTPNEIVNFMIESTNYLLDKHLSKTLADENVDILDPATGTGTFIVDLLHHIPKQYLKQKYKNEIHANEVAILPYYIANLNIEQTYRELMGEHDSFDNIVFVDTLDNIESLNYKDKQNNLFGTLSQENLKRIKDQNARKISVIIGNPPYNANQQNENDNNKNRTYFFDSKKKTGGVDGRIKDTFIKYSTAQKTKVYDMYARFYRWSMDRIGDDGKGIIAFITNNSFVNSRTFDGFRKSIQMEFDYAYIIDLGGNIRELSGKDGIFLNEKNTIFGKAAAVGIAIMFLVRTGEKETHQNAAIRYIHPCDIRATRDEKLEYLAATPLKNIPFKRIPPDKNNNWTDIAANIDWDKQIALCSKNAKLSKGNETIFEWYSLGVSTNRDAWVYDVDKKNLQNKITYFIDKYNALLKEKEPIWDNAIKWSRDLKHKFSKKVSLKKNNKLVIFSNYRPFTKRYWYADKKLNDILTQNHYDIFGENLDKPNMVIAFSGTSSSKPFQVLATNNLWSLDFLEKTQALPLYRYDKNGNRIDNITDWGLAQFRQHYQDETISKEAIFNYTYAILHCPDYRSKYELSLKREYPRLPFYADFQKWANWGQELISLHIGYETATPYPLSRQESDKPKATPAPKLKAEKEKGIIILDENTQLLGIPDAAWDYKLGNRAAIDWVLDQYKESKSTDATLPEHFDTYRFADHKETVIDLLLRICTVSVRTIEIMAEMNTQLI